MTIEVLLGRIATALESIAANGGTAVVAADAPAKQTRGRPAKGEKDGVATAPVAAAGAAPAAATPVVAAATPAVPEADPFDTSPAAVAAAATPAATPAAAPLVLEDVRNALIAAGKRLNSPEKSRAILKEVGGVDVLAGLPEAKFATVIAAANKAGV